jgi:SAM-dependent methyltransferase
LDALSEVDYDSTAMTTASDQRYTTGEYLQATGGTWHLEDAPFKARQIMKMLGRNKLAPASMMEIGCGAGGILAELARELPKTTRLVGYEISPQAHEMSRKFEMENLRFVLGDAIEVQESAEVVLVMDVIEHVEDCFGFLRKVKKKGDRQIYHIPLDIHCSSVLRDSFSFAWHQVGHIHVFSKALAMETLRATGHEIIDWFYTPSALEVGKGFKRHLANLPRRLLPRTLASRLLGGFSLMVLTR